MKLFNAVSFNKVPTLLCLMSIFRNTIFILPVIVIVYQYKGVTPAEFFLVQGLFSVISFILEIPTGYIGDIFSRKKVICFGVAVYFVGYLVLFAFHGFACVLTAELLWGVALALFSGTTEAYLYDVLKHQGEEFTYMRMQSRVNVYGCLGACISTFVGGIIYHSIGADKTILVELVFIFIAFCLSLMLPELEGFQRQVDSGKSKMRDILEISKRAIERPYIKWLMLFPSFFGSTTLIMFWSLQPVMEKSLIPVSLFGLFIGINQLCRVAFTRFSPFVFERLEIKNFSLFFFALVSTGCLIIIFLPYLESRFLSYPLLTVLCVIVASFSGLQLASKTMINHKIESEERATVLSVQEMFSRLINAIAMIVIYYLMSGGDIKNMLSITIPIFLVLTCISMINFLKVRE